MKNICILVLITMITTSASDCRHERKETRYEGKLEVKGICSNYTISVLSANIDTSLVEATWKDTETGKLYKNVFALDDPCSFPSNIKEGERFYFTIQNQVATGCVVCMAYYPRPSKKINIKVEAQ